MFNGIDKLNITSVAAGTVVLKGESVEETLVFWNGAVTDNSETHSEDYVWAIDLVIGATPTNCAVILLYGSDNTGGGVPLWIPVAMGG